MRYTMMLYKVNKGDRRFFIDTDWNWDFEGQKWHLVFICLFGYCIGIMPGYGSRWQNRPLSKPIGPAKSA